MQVDDVTTSAFDVHALIKKRNGLISSEDTQSSGDMTYSNITAQIPAADLDAFIADVSALGTVTSINVNAQDVTTQVVDLDARIKALQTSIDRLTQLLAEASRIEDLLAIETQLSQRQAELDALTAQRTWLGDQVAMSTITVSLSPVTQIADVDAPGFLSGLQSGWSAFLSLIMVAVTAVGFFLPFLLVLALIAIPVTIVIVRQARRHHPRTAPAAPADPRACRAAAGGGIGHPDVGWRNAASSVADHPRAARPRPRARRRRCGARAAAAEDLRIPGAASSADDPTPVSLDATLHLPGTLPAPGGRARPRLRRQQGLGGRGGGPPDATGASWSWPTPPAGSAPPPA